MLHFNFRGYTHHILAMTKLSWLHARIRTLKYHIYMQGNSDIMFYIDTVIVYSITTLPNLALFRTVETLCWLFYWNSRLPVTEIYF